MLGLPADDKAQNVSKFFPDEADGSKIFKFLDGTWQIGMLKKVGDKIVAVPASLKINPGDAVWIYSPKSFKIEWKVKSEGYDSFSGATTTPPPMPPSDGSSSSYESSSSSSYSGDNDLGINFVECPVNRVYPSYEFNDNMQIEAYSYFDHNINTVSVDIFLSETLDYTKSDTYAIYDSSYSDGVLLEGGREHIDFTPYETQYVKLNGNNKIPYNTPPGKYYLGVAVEIPFQIVVE